MTQPSVLLTCFNYRWMNGTTHASIVEEIILAERTKAKLAYSQIVGEALIDKARSMAASIFFLSAEMRRHDVLVMVDDDMVWDSGAVMSLAHRAHAEQAVVGAIYPKRGFGAGFAFHPQGDSVVITIGDDRCVECDHIGTGFMAIPRSVLAAIVDGLDTSSQAWRDKFKGAAGDVDQSLRLAHLSVSLCHSDRCGNYYSFFRPFPGLDRGKPAYFAEDYAFCERVHHVGCRLLADLSLTVKHIGEHAFTVEDCQPREAPVTEALTDAEAKRRDRKARRKRLVRN